MVPGCSKGKIRGQLGMIQRSQGVSLHQSYTSVVISMAAHSAKAVALREMVDERNHDWVLAGTAKRPTTIQATRVRAHTKTMAVQHGIGPAMAEAHSSN